MHPQHFRIYFSSQLSFLDQGAVEARKQTYIDQFASNVRTLHRITFRSAELWTHDSLARACSAAARRSFANPARHSGRLPRPIPAPEGSGPRRSPARAIRSSRRSAIRVPPAVRCGIADSLENSEKYLRTVSSSYRLIVSNQDILGAIGGGNSADPGGPHGHGLG